MPSYLTSNLKLGNKSPLFTNSKERLVESDEELGQDKQIYAAKRSVTFAPSDSFPNVNKVAGITAFGIVRYLVMLIYIMFAFASFRPNDYLSPCNAANLMSIKEINLLKENISDVHEELSSISVVNAYRLNKNATAILDQKHRNFTALLINFEAELGYQQNEYFNCYKQNIKNYMDLQKFPVIGFTFLMAILHLTVFYFLWAAKTPDLTSKQLRSLKHNFFGALFFLLIDGIFVCVFLDAFKLEKKFAKFPL